MARSKERYRRLVRGYSSMNMPSIDTAWAITMCSVGYPVVAIYCRAWWTLPLTLVFIVIAYDAHRSQREIADLHHHLMDDDVFDALSIDDVRWIHTRARRRFVGVMALLLAAAIMMFVPAMV